MYWLLVALACLLQSIGICGFNIDIGSAVVFDGPGESEYFGFSVALHSQQSRHW